MEGVFGERRALTTFTAILCVASLLGVTGAPALQFNYWCDHNRTWPGISETVDWFAMVIAKEIAGMRFILELAFDLVGVFKDISGGDVAQGSGAIISIVADILLEGFKKYGLPWTWQYKVVWIAANFVWWA